jgi:LPXTG-motif cell wall-anchored protein
MLDANKVLENKDVTDNDVRVAIKNIDNAIATLQYKIAFELNNCLLELESNNEADYTSDSYARFIEAIQYAESIKDGSEYDIYKGAYDGLIEAHSQLTLLNRNDLNEMIKRAESIDLDQYLDEGKSEFKAALENAKKVYETVSLTQKQVDDATKSLGHSINALKKIPESVSKDELNKLIKEVELLDQTKYTEESWNVMMDALAKAKEVANNENATQEEVNEAYRNLENAKNSLVEKDNNNGKPGNGDNNGDGSSNGNNEGKPNNGGKLPSTGGTSSVALSLLGIAMATSGMFISKKKKINS